VKALSSSPSITKKRKENDWTISSPPYINTTVPVPINASQDSLRSLDFCSLQAAMTHHSILTGIVLEMMKQEASTLITARGIAKLPSCHWRLLPPGKMNSLSPTVRGSQ
jgi:hypothetical protein